LLQRYPRSRVVEALRAAIEGIRQRLREGAGPGVAENRDELANLAIKEAQCLLEGIFAPPLSPLINATGVILHTNLGRAPLGEAATKALAAVAGRYCALEVEPSSGERGQRLERVEKMLTALSGAEAALVVNNNAAAVYLILETLARDREVVVSRGELIEIGGNFRLPDIMNRAGARLVEVGTTNRTYLKDYSAAIHTPTAMLWHSHQSNFRQLGYVERPSGRDLARLGKEQGIPVVEDLGSGLLIDLTPLGFPAEPTVPGEVAAGMDLVCFSGDKLLGGPQAGIIVGKRHLVERLAASPLMRILRVEKLILAALEATLQEYLKEDHMKAIPVLALLSRSIGEVEQTARELAGQLEKVLAKKAGVVVEAGNSPVGGGTLPAALLPTFLVGVKPSRGTARDWAKKLRFQDPSIWTRVGEETIWIDPRSLLPGEPAKIIEGFQRLIATRS